MLHKLLSAIDRERFASSVVSLTDVGPIGDKIRALGIPVEALRMRHGIADPTAIVRLARRLRVMRAQVVQTWMHHADLLGSLGARLGGDPPVAWGLRLTEIHPDALKRTTAFSLRLLARMSARWPEKIVCCSEATRVTHTRLGYATRNMIVIPNGFDLSEFRPDADARLQIRDELGIGAGLLVGVVGRFDPHKDLRSFVSMAGSIASTRDDVRFLGCGAGISEENEVLMGWINDAGLEDRFHLLGPRRDMPRVMAALDVFVSSSVSEGFPNVVGEAMAAEVPCVVTDVGDSALIVGDSGRVVPSEDHKALARECLDLLDDDGLRGRLGVAARQRIAERFSLPEITKRYENLYEEMALACAD